MKNNFSSKNKLIKRLRKNLSKNEGLIKLLELRKHKPITINPKLNKNIENNEEKFIYDGLKLIEKTNINFEENKINYEEKKKENQEFFNNFNSYKSMKEKNIIDEIAKKEYAFGKLLKSYEDRGISFNGNFFHKDIYNKSGILIRKKKTVEEYFANEVKNEGVKSRKIIKYQNFIKKLSNVANERLFFKLPFKNPAKQESLKKLTNFKTEKIKDDENKIQNEIKTQIEENNLIENLIILEKQNYEKENRDFNEINQNKNIKIGQKLRINEENIKNQNEKNHSFNNAENPNKIKVNFNKDNEISELLLLMDSKDNIMPNKINSSLPSIQESNEKFEKFIFSNNKNSQTSRTIESGLFKTRLKRKTIFNKKNVHFPFIIGGIKNKRKSNLIIKNNILSNTERSLKSSLGNQAIIKNNSQPNLISAEDTYEKLLKYDICSKENKINDILCDYYGDKLKGIKINNNKMRIINYLKKMKEDIYQSEQKNRIYIKYKGIIPDEFNEKILQNQIVNEKLKNRVFHFVQSYCKKLNKLSEIK